jgi:hypothetical protein
MRRHPNGASITLNVTTAKGMQNALRKYTGLNELVIIGHSGRTGIHLGQEAQPGTNISAKGGPNDVSPSNFYWNSLKADGVVKLWGCNAGAQPNPVAQDVANASKRKVEAYPNYTILGPNGPSTLNRTALTQDLYRGYTYGFNLDDFYREGPINNRGGSYGGIGQIGSGKLTFTPEE